MRKFGKNIVAGLGVCAVLAASGCGNKTVDPAGERAVRMNELTGVAGVIPVGNSGIAVLNRAESMAGLFRFVIGADTSFSGQMGTGLPPNSAEADSTNIYTLTSDYTDGYLSIANTVTNAVLKNLQLVSNDATVRLFGDFIYIIQRGTGYGKVSRISKTDPAGTGTALTGLTGDNAHDISFVDAGKAYLSRYEAVNLWIFNPTTMVKTGEIDLSAYVAFPGTDSAGTVPSMSDLALSGNRLFVACQRMISWTPRDSSLIVVVDTDADTVLKAIPLQKKNPYHVSLYGDKLYVACLGSWYALDGGVEVINTSTLASEGMLITESEAGGDISGITVVSADYGYIITAGTWPNSTVQAFNPADGSLY